MSDNTLSKVISIISEQLGVDESQITSESNFVEDLGADSLDVVELVMSIEEEFSVTIPDDVAEKMKTVGDVVSYIKSS